MPVAARFAPMWSSTPVSPLAGLHLLLADDSDSIRQLYAEAFRRAGAEVAEVADGAEAVATYRDADERGRPFDVVVLDYAMPELNGAEAASRLRSIGFNGTIVGVSGEVSADGEDAWLAKGCDRVLCKGMSLQDLVAAVAAACGRWAG